MIFLSKSMREKSKKSLHPSKDPQSYRGKVLPTGVHISKSESEETMNKYENTMALYKAEFGEEKDPDVKDAEIEAKKESEDPAEEEAKKEEKKKDKETKVLKSEMPDRFERTLGIFDDLVKSGAGSRGGKVIGHTKSGKPIYANRSGTQSGWSKEERVEAGKKRSDHADKHDPVVNSGKSVIGRTKSGKPIHLRSSDANYKGHEHVEVAKVHADAMKKKGNNHEDYQDHFASKVYHEKKAQSAAMADLDTPMNPDVKKSVDEYKPLEYDRVPDDVLKSLGDEADKFATNMIQQSASLSDAVTGFSENKSSQMNKPHSDRKGAGTGVGAATVVVPNRKCSGCMKYIGNLSACEIGSYPAICGDFYEPIEGGLAETAPRNGSGGLPRHWDSVDQAIDKVNRSMGKSMEPHAGTTVIKNCACYEEMRKSLIGKDLRGVNFEADFVCTCLPH